ncbi:MAG: DUF4214 domain-containing protein [Clostridia bacterium]|nr:DUF4214 domain-containing protein [Clostridia bacterium]NCD02762.1 DUF4214 domain-containing protein [Clostridia bacterium]
MKKRSEVLMLAVIMALTLPTAVYAEGETESVEETYIEETHTEETYTEESYTEEETTSIEETASVEETLSFEQQLIEENATPIGTVTEEDPGRYALYSGPLDVTDVNSGLVPITWSSYYNYDEAHKVLELVNQIRAENGIAPLVWDYELEMAACIRAAECSIVFDHTRPNGQSCTSLTDRMNGENIAAGPWLATQVVANWMNSDGHRANILNPNYKSMGVSVSYVNDGSYEYYWSQNFGISDGDGQYAKSGLEDVTQIIEAVGTEAGCQIKNFVIRLYEKVLGRKADYAGLADWFNQLVNGENTGAGVAQGFVFSDEFKNRNLSDGDYIEILYKTMFDRSSDPGGKQGWQEDLKTGFSRAYVYHGFAESAEFTDLCTSFGIQRGSVGLGEARDQNAGVTRFVSRLYSKALSRTPDINGLNDWAGQIIRNESTPENVAHGFLFSDEMRKKGLSDAEFVKVLYRVFLDREADGNGLTDWTGRLKNGTSREDVMYGFSKSAEFGDILRSFGLS